MNLVLLKTGERIASVAAVREFDPDHFLVFATKKGQVKKTNLTAYANVRRDGIIAIALDEGDELIGVVLTDGRRDVVLAKRLGKAIRFNESKVRAMGRNARGVRGVTLDTDGDEVIGMVVLKREDSEILAVTVNGLRQAESGRGLPRHRPRREGHHHHQALDAQRAPDRHSRGEIGR